MKGPAMTDHQTHPIDQVKPPPLFDKVIATVNANYQIQGLLYDLGLLPEQTMAEPLQWARTASIALDLAERDEQIRVLNARIAELESIGVNAK